MLQRQPGDVGAVEESQPRLVSSRAESAVALGWLPSQNAGVGHRLDRDGLRAAVYLAEPDVLLGVLTGRDWPDDALQLVGDAVLFLARERRQDVKAAARQCLGELRDRDWEGDSELATQIESAFGWGPTPLLRSIPVDLEELAGVLEGDPLRGGGRIDLRSGEVWPQSVWDYAEEAGDDEDEDEDDDAHWLRVHCDGSRRGYRDMEFFIELMENPPVADRLARAIQGRGAFRRFKDVLSGWPDLLERWYGFSDDRQRGRARAWLAAEGYTPAPPQRGE